jgi:hypothetical protein
VAAVVLPEACDPINDFWIAFCSPAATLRGFGAAAALSF